MKIDKVIKSMFPQPDYYFRFRFDNEIYDERYPFVTFAENLSNLCLPEMELAAAKMKLTSKEDISNFLKILIQPK